MVELDPLDLLGEWEVFRFNMFKQETVKVYGSLRNEKWWYMVPVEEVTKEIFFCFT